MAHDDKTKDIVRRHYVFDGLTLEQAADKAGVAYGTVRRWRKEALARGDDWDKARDAHTIAGGKLDEVARGLLTGFVLYFGNVMDELKQDASLSSKEKALLLTGMGDSFTKMTAASKKILPDVSERAAALRTVELMTAHIQAHKPQLLGDFLDLLDSFGLVLNKEFKD